MEVIFEVKYYKLLFKVQQKVLIDFLNYLQVVKSLRTTIKEI